MTLRFRVHRVDACVHVYVHAYVHVCVCVAMAPVLYHPDLAAAAQKAVEYRIVVGHFDVQQNPILGSGHHQAKHQQVDFRIILQVLSTVAHCSCRMQLPEVGPPHFCHVHTAILGVITTTKTKRVPARARCV